MTRAPPGGPLCPRCLGRGEACLCAALTTVQSRAQVVVLQHVLEVPKVSNTVRFARLALSSCEVRLYGDREHPLELPELDQTWLVFPGEQASRPEGPTPKRLLLLDASWSQARRMFQRLPALHLLPRLSLPAPAAQRLREGPEGTMSTLEAMAEALEVLGESAPAAHLRATHTLICERQRALRGYVGAPL